MSSTALIVLSTASFMASTQSLGWLEGNCAGGRIDASLCLTTSLALTGIDIFVNVESPLFDADRYGLVFARTGGLIIKFRLPEVVFSLLGSRQFLFVPLNYLLRRVTGRQIPG